MRKLIIVIFFLFLATPVFASTKQIIIGGSRDDPLTDGTTQYNTLMGSGDEAWSSTELGQKQIIPTNGSLKNFKVQVKTAPGAGKSWTFTVRTGNPIGDSALSVSIADTNTISSLDTSEVSVSAGDFVDISAVGTGTPTAAGAVYWVCEFTPTTAGETILSVTSKLTVWDNALEYGSLVGTNDPTTTRFNGQTIFPTAGTLKNLYLELDNAPGAGKSRTFTIEKNGVDSGITVTLSDSETTKSDLVNTLSVAAGDQIAIEQTAVTGTPSATRLKIGIIFVPDTQGQWITAATIVNALNTTTTEYSQLTAGDVTLTATENEQYNLARATTAKAIYVALSADPGTSPDAYSFTLRKNGTTNTALTTTITADSTTGNFSTDVTISDDDLLTTEIVPLNTPATAVAATQIGYLFYNRTPTTINNATLNNCVIQ